MKKIIRIILAVAVCSVIFLFTLLFEHVKYDTPLNVIESVKYFEPTEKVHAYRPIALTPTSYKSSISKTEIVAKAIYQGDTIGLKFVIMNTKPTIYMESIGQASNHFVKAISELYEEKTVSSVMRPQIKGDCIHSGGFFLIKRFAVGYKTSLNSPDGKNADTHIWIDLPNKKIEIGDRHNGLAKKRFVTVFPFSAHYQTSKNTDGRLVGWAQFPEQEWLNRSLFSVKQDTKLLDENIVKLGGRFLQDIVAWRHFDPSSIDWFLPHLSSMYFEEKVEKQLQACGYDVPREKWFINLPEIGNVASVSPFAMPEELNRSGRVKPGDRLLLMVPESACFSYTYALLTAV